MISIYNYFKRNITPSRELCNIFMKKVLHNMKGKIIEIGAVDSRYQRLTKNSNYILTNIEPSSKKNINYLDATNMNLDDSSVDTFIIENTLEHIYDYQKVILNCYKKLKKDGLVIIIVPFNYPYHGAPSDFFRFTDPGLRILLKDFEIIKLNALGNFFSTISTYFQLKYFPWDFKKSRLTLLRFLQFFPLLCLGYIFYLISLSKFGKNLDDFTTLFGIVAKKK